MDDQAGRSRSPTAEDSSRRGRILWWIRLAAVLALLAGVIYLTGPRRLWQTLQGVQWVWIAAALPFALAATAVDAAKYDLLLKPHGYREGWGAVFRTCLVVNFASLFLPGTVGGGAVAWHRFSRKSGLHAESFAALSVNALLKAAVTFATALVALTFDPAMRAGSAGRLICLVMIGLLPLLALALFLHTRTLNALAHVYSRLGGWKWTPRRVHAALGKVLDAFESYKAAPGTVYAGLGLVLLRKLLENVCFMMSIWAVGASVDFLRVLWIMCIVEASGMIPLALGGLGVPQVTYYALFVSQGMSESCALASNIISWVIFFPIYLAGAAVLLIETVLSPRADRP